MQVSIRIKYVSFPIGRKSVLAIRYSIRILRYIILFLVNWLSEDKIS